MWNDFVTLCIHKLETLKKHSKIIEKMYNNKPSYSSAFRIEDGDLVKPVGKK